MEKDLRILMLEDLAEDVGLIEYALRKEGLNFQGQSVDSEEEFIDALHAFQPDVVLSDHALPQFNSIEALKICKRDRPHIPFILVTGTVSEEFAVSCLKQGADDYVLKSNLVRLPSAIFNALKQHEMEMKRKDAELALRTQNEELVKINRELDSFVYSVSHNLRAPLMSVLGLLQLAQMDDQKQGGIFSKYFSMMEHSVHKLDDTLKEILDYSRNARSEMTLEVVDIAKVIDDGFERLKYLQGSDQIEKIINIKNQQTSFVSDPYRLPVIFNNLISNSIKYRDVSKSEMFIKIDATISEEAVRIQFEDNGIGIDEELLHKIFDMFFRATERSEGAGLGLYIVKETIHKLDGKIHASSKYNQGTSFTIEIPNKKRFVEIN